MMMMKTSGIVVVTLPEMKGRWKADPLGSCKVSIYSFTFLCSGIQKGCRVSKFSLFCVFYCSCLLEKKNGGDAPWPWRTMELQFLLWQWRKEVMFMSIFANISTEINERRRKINSFKHRVSLLENLLLRHSEGHGLKHIWRLDYTFYKTYAIFFLAWRAFTFFQAVGRFSRNHLI